MTPDTSCAEYIPLRAPAAVVSLMSAVGVPLSSAVNASWRVKGLCNGRYPAPDTLCFVDRPPDERQREHLRDTVVLAPPSLAADLQCRGLLECKDPRAVFIDLVEQLQSRDMLSPFTSLTVMPAGIDGTAQVHPRAEVEANVIIGPGCQIAAGCVVKQGTVLMQNVVVRENTVIGCAGIARYVTADGRVLHFPHVAGVIIDAGVEIGANCVVARGALTSTHIGAGSIIGNLCNVGHGVLLGSKTWMSVGCLIGGNCRFGDRVTLGLGVQVRDNLHLGEGASAAMGSVVMRSVIAGGSVLGNPAKAVPGVVAGPDR